MLLDISLYLNVTEDLFIILRIQKQEEMVDLK